METDESCPDVDALRRYLRGDSDEALVDHVERCPACADRLAALRDDVELELQLLMARSLAGADPIPQALPSIEGYEVEGEIHRGGQGVVYRALQRSTKRTVAIKLLLDGAFASARQRERFEREVELAASLDHPGIVSVHDSGVTDDGRSYFVMECIDGVPANRYRGERERIDIAIEICEAVEAAHLRGVLHRDLKPGNILVDREGRPHVLDFGLAAPASRPGDSPRLTLTGEFMGTLAYASPEHVTRDPDQLDVRSDVYALGVILYELFNGRLPYDVDGAPLDAVRAVAEAEPAPFDERDVELETIVLKALTKEKERRYPSAGALADDLRRYRNGEPLWARRDSVRYVLAKSIRRYRWRAAVVALVFVGTVASTVAIAALNRRLQGERDLAIRQSERANEIGAFFRGSLRSLAPSSARGRTVELREVLDTASARLREDPPRFPEAELELRESVGIAYRDLGLASEALPHLERAAELAESLHGPKSDDFGDALMVLGDVEFEVARLDRAQRSYARALDAYRAVGDLYEQGLIEIRLARVDIDRGDIGAAETIHARGTKHLANGGAKGIAMLMALFERSRIEEARGRLGEAEATARECIERASTLGDLEIEGYSQKLLGFVLANGGRHAEALQALDVACDLYRRLFGPSHLRTVHCRTLRALSLHAVEHRDVAAEELAECLAFREALEETPSQSSARALSNLGALARRLGDPALAVELDRASLAQFNAITEVDTLYEATTLSNLAWALYELGRSDEAAETAHAALAIETSSSSRRAQPVSVLHTLLGWIDARAARFAVALEHARRAVEIAEDADDRAAANALAVLGTFSFYSGAANEAIPSLEEALRLYRASGHGADAGAAEAMHSLGEALQTLGRAEEAAEHLRRALSIRRRRLGDRSTYTAQSMNALAMNMMVRRDASTKARELLEEALEVLAERDDPGGDSAWVLNNLSTWYRVRENDLDAAAELASEAVERARETAAPGHPVRALTMANLGLVESALGNHRAARDAFEESSSILTEQFGLAHPQARQVLGLLASACRADGDPESAAEIEARLAGR
ncbi:MAG: serine/threonine-protein kinase [Planctomycetota bacterium]